ncbi:hypothetical protein Slin15195_G089920 [Septoria linicola]|uniref:Myb-like domain-containing protein n=1 Tax=Septoria linicola TaxID=215465 RepID=A0A9Q9AYS1_9PEZI|nr:hypothetical protein Slin14017_G125530 [Septoria linicola]USW55673.1 hypothetical protein Slin15195_G089920 [Septoria linicola]
MAKAYAATAPGKPTVAPAQTTRRTTRSQSAEPQEAAKLRVASTKRNSAEPPTIPKKGGRNMKAKSAIEDLPTVDENAFDEENEGGEDVDARLAEQLNAQENDASPRRISSGSVFSGTTAKTSFSQDEISKLDHEVICEVLPDLFTASEKLTQLLMPNGVSTPPQTWKEIKLTGSRLNKLYSARWDSLRIHKPNLTSVEYVDPSYILRALLNVQSVADVQSAAWRPDDVLHRINISLMLRAVLMQCDPFEWTEEATGALENLDMAFPACIAGSEFSFAALELWLDLAAQVAIHRIESASLTDPDFSALEEVDNVFFDSDNEFKHAKSLGILTASQEDHDRALEMVKQLVVVLKAPFEQGDGTGVTASNGYLKAQFRWDDFKSHALKYCETRVAELDRRIQSAGGARSIVDGLQQEADRRAHEKKAEQMMQSYTKTGTTPRQSLGSRSAIAKLKEREKQMAAKAPVPAPTFTAPVAQMTAPNNIPQQEDVITQDFATYQPTETVQISEEPQPEVPSTAQQALARFSATQKQNARKAKARLIDRQENAVRISSDMYEESQAPVASNKRTRRQMEEEEDDVPDEFEPTQDDGFENDSRTHTHAAQRRAEVAFPQRPPRRSPTLEARSSPVAGPSTLTASAAAQPSPSKRQRKNPGSAIPPPRARLDPEDGEAPSAEFYKRAKQDAKYNRVLSTQERPIQSRVPWSDAEEMALIDLIVEHVGDDESISYSSLKAIDRSLEENGEAMLSIRSAEDIRFKARNMKLTLLLADRKLPKNWDKVMLDKKAQDKLRSRGIIYEQPRVRAVRRTQEDESTPAPSDRVQYQVGGRI